MSVEKKLSLLQSCFKDSLYNKNKKSLSIFCPKCYHHKRKLCISLEKNVFHCFVCNYKGTIKTLLAANSTPEIYKQWISNFSKSESNRIDFFSKLETESDISLISLPNETKVFTFDLNHQLEKKALSFLYNRGITRDIIEMYNIRYVDLGHYSNRIIVPSYDDFGTLNFFIARSFCKNVKMKYLYPEIPKTNLIFNDLFIEWNFPIILVEGVFDALKINYNTIPLLGSSLTENALLFKKIIKFNPSVTLMLDTDVPGQIASKNIASLLLKWNIDTYFVEYSYKDPGEMNRTEIFKSLKNRKKITQTTLMKQILE